MLDSVMKVLLAEDDPTLKMLMSRLMKKIGVDFHVVENGAALVDEFSMNPCYDLIVSDYIMPQMSGLEAIYRIKKFRDVPAVIVTGTDISDVVIQVDGEKVPWTICDAIIRKPYDFKDIVDCINGYC